MKTMVNAILTISVLVLGVSMLTACAEGFKARNMKNTLAAKTQNGDTGAPGVDVKRESNAVKVKTADMTLELSSAAISSHVGGEGGLSVNIVGTLNVPNSYSQALNITLFSNGKDSKADIDGKESRLVSGNSQVISMARCQTNCYVKINVLLVENDVTKSSRIIGVKVFDMSGTDAYGTADSATVHVFAADENPTMEQMIEAIEGSVADQFIP